MIMTPSSQYVDGKHITSIRIRYLPDDWQEPMEVARIRIANWLKDNCGFFPHHYSDYYKVPNSKAEGHRGQKLRRSWVIVTKSMQDRDELKSHDIHVLQRTGFVRIVYEFTPDAYNYLLKTDPHQIGINKRLN